MRQRHISTLLPLLVAVAGVRVLGSIVLPIYDDAFITFRYGENLIEKGAFLYNPGEWVLGTTTPVFGLLSATFYALGLSVPIAMLVLNVCIDIGIAYLLFRFIAEEFNLNAAIFSLLLFAVSPMVTRITVGCMESNLFVLVILISLLLYRQRHIVAAIIIASLSYFIRPEGAALALFLIAHVVYAKQFGQALKYALLSLAVVLPGLVLLYLSYGSFIPHSVIAKSGEHQGLLEVFRRLVVPEALSIIILALSFVGIRPIVRSKGVVVFYWAFTALYLAAYLIMRPWIWSWYALPVQVATIVGAGIGIASLLERVALFGKPLWYRYAPAIGMCGVIGVWVTLFMLKGASGVTKNIYHALDTSLPKLENSTIIATDIGAIGYYSRGRMYDALGLVTPEALGHASLLDMIEVNRPDALFLNTSSETRDMMNVDLIKNNYTFVRRFGPGGDTTLPSDTSEYIAGWQQDYLLFAKRPQ